MKCFAVALGCAALCGSAAALQKPAGAAAAVSRAQRVNQVSPAATLHPLRGGAKASAVAPAKSKVDMALLAYFAFWYLGNYYYNITNKLCLKAAGGRIAAALGSNGFPMTIASLQLGVGVLYALFAWVAPDMRPAPTITLADAKKMMPVAFCSMMAHCSSVFALSAGAVSFGQIVKAAEPAFAAVLSQFVYGRPISTGKWMCLIPVIGGVVIASVKELDFAVSALVAASAANLFAAFKGNENKKLMVAPGLKERIGTVGNQFALTSIFSFLMSVPLFIATEGGKWGEFCDLLKNNNAVLKNLLWSGFYFYGYNELATMTIKKTSAITQSVANTAKRVIVIIAVALVLGESLPPVKLLGSAICIAGVFLYSIIDSLLAAKK